MPDDTGFGAVRERLLGIKAFLCTVRHDSRAASGAQASLGSQRVPGHVANCTSTTLTCCHANRSICLRNKNQVGLPFFREYLMLQWDARYSML